MKKVALAISLIVIVAVGGGAWLLLNQIMEQKPAENNSSNETNQTYNVKITEFKWTGSWAALGGVTAAIPFNLTIHNLEKFRDINGLTVEVKILNANGSEIQTKTMWDLGQGIFGTDPFDVGVLHAGEVRTLTGAIWSDWNTMDNAWALGPTTTVATIKLGNVVLDEVEVTD